MIILRMLLLLLIIMISIINITNKRQYFYTHTHTPHHHHQNPVTLRQRPKVCPWVSPVWPSCASVGTDAVPPHPLRSQWSRWNGCTRGKKVLEYIHHLFVVLCCVCVYIIWEIIFCGFSYFVCCEFPLVVYKEIIARIKPYLNHTNGCESQGKQMSLVYFKDLQPLNMFYKNII